jgi:hypothetical protein
MDSVSSGPTPRIGTVGGTELIGIDPTCHTATLGKEAPLRLPETLLITSQGPNIDKAARSRSATTWSAEITAIAIESLRDPSNPTRIS